MFWYEFVQLLFCCPHILFGSGKMNKFHGKMEWKYEFTLLENVEISCLFSKIHFPWTFEGPPGTPPWAFSVLLRSPQWVLDHKSPLFSHLPRYLKGCRPCRHHPMLSIQLFISKLKIGQGKIQRLSTWGPLCQSTDSENVRVPQAVSPVPSCES